MPSSPTTRRKTLGLWLAALALWVQLLLPAMLCPGGTARPMETHNLCMAGSPAPAHHDDVPLHKGQCPACLTLQALHGGFVPPQAIAFAYPQSAGTAVVHSAAANLLPHRSSPGLQARAPPLPT